MSYHTTGSGPNYYHDTLDPALREGDFEAYLLIQPLVQREIRYQLSIATPNRANKDPADSANRTQISADLNPKAIQEIEQRLMEAQQRSLQWKQKVWATISLIV